MRPANQTIERFTREILGCNCPAEVFHYIECQGGPSLGKNDPRAFRINIGHRLLIYIVECNDLERLEHHIRTLTALGEQERDCMRFNRFRLVITTETPDTTRARAQALFAAVNPDDRLHLHVIHSNAFPGQ